MSRLKEAVLAAIVTFIGVPLEAQQTPPDHSKAPTV